MLYIDYLDNFVQRNTLNPDQMHSGNIGDYIAPGTVTMGQTNFGYMQDWVTPDGLIGITTEFITDKLDAEAGYIKGEFTFTPSGSIAISQDANNGLWISPNGILGKKNGDNTFTITNQGDATFAGTLAAATGIIQDIIANNITITGGSISWASVTAPSYTQVTGTKPPTDAEANPSYIHSTYISATTVQSPTISSPSITGGVITGSLIQTSVNANTGVKISGAYGGMVIYGGSLFLYTTTGLYRGVVGHTASGVTFQSISSDIYFNSGNNRIFFRGDLLPDLDGVWRLGNSTYRMTNVHTYNIEFSSGRYINYTSSKITFHADIKTNGSVYWSGNFFHENSGAGFSFRARDLGGTYRTTYLRSVGTFGYDPTWTTKIENMYLRLQPLLSGKHIFVT